jgi:hypothetical protein
MKIIQKNKLKGGQLYQGYVNQNYCILTGSEQLVVAKWDHINNCFWFENEVKLSYLYDIDNEIEDGFIPIKELTFSV